jgi:hypothetical protein
MINDLRLEDLKNNYFNENVWGEYWTINYNKLFYIVGNYDSEVEEINKLLELINFKKIKEECLNEVKSLRWLFSFLLKYVII